LADDLLILLEHPRVITLGRGASDSNVITPTRLLQERGVQIHEIERGGDVTYHGPGQLVGYPILDLRLYKQDLHWYLRQLEQAIIGALEDFDIPGSRVPGYTGVWVENRKIASIGVHVTRWVTFHGFALNVTTDLSDFDLIVPCGIQAVEMTSIEKETGRHFALSEVVDRVAASFASVFGVAMKRADLDSISALLSD
jgi:lipoate-protein ligase B